MKGGMFGLAPLPVRSPVISNISQHHFSKTPRGGACVWVNGRRYPIPTHFREKPILALAGSTVLSCLLTTQNLENADIGRAVKNRWDSNRMTGLNDSNPMNDMMNGMILCMNRHGSRGDWLYSVSFNNACRSHKEINYEWNSQSYGF